MVIYAPEPQHTAQIHRQLQHIVVQKSISDTLSVCHRSPITDHRSPSPITDHRGTSSPSFRRRSSTNAVISHAVAALGAVRGAGTLLFGLEPWDPVTLAAAVALQAVVTVVAWSRR
jgi:hypothetical protein